MSISVFHFCSCQSSETKTKKPAKTTQTAKTKTKQQNNKQQNISNKSKLNESNTKIRKQKKNKKKYPSMAEQKMELGLTPPQIKEIQSANAAAKNAKNIAKKRNNGKLSKADSKKIDAVRNNRLRNSLGNELMAKRQTYIQNYKNK